MAARSRDVGIDHVTPRRFRAICRSTMTAIGNDDDDDDEDDADPVAYGERLTSACNSYDAKRF